MLAITNARIYTMAGPVIEKGTVLIDKGKVTEVGACVDIPSKAEVVDLGGNTLTPGFIEAHSHLVAHDWITAGSALDSGSGGQGGLGPAATADIDYYYNFNPHHRHLEDARIAGVTTALIRPGSGKVINGIGFVAKTYGKTRGEMILKRPDGIKLALGENPKRNFGGQGKIPSTRMGSAAVLRDALAKAQNYRAAWERYQAKKREYLEALDDCNGEEAVKAAKAPKLPATDRGLELLVRMLDGELPARVHAHRADDIMTALRIADEFGFRVTIEHATEGHKIANEIAARDVPCIVGPSFTSRGKVELRNRTFATAGILERAGVKVAITTDAGVVFIGYLRTCASLAYRHGLSEDGALKGITLAAAEIIGVGHRVGSIEPGKDADFAVLDGHPLELTTRVIKTYIDGKEVYDAATYQEPWERQGYTT